MIMPVRVAICRCGFQLYTKVSLLHVVLYGSTSIAADAKRNTEGLGSSSYDAGEYSYELSADAMARSDGNDVHEVSGATDNGPGLSFSGSRPLTACGTSACIMIYTT